MASRTPPPAQMATKSPQRTNGDGVTDIRSSSSYSEMATRRNGAPPPSPNRATRPAAGAIGITAQGSNGGLDDHVQHSAKAALSQPFSTDGPSLNAKVDEAVDPSGVTRSTSVDGNISAADFQSLVQRVETSERSIASLTTSVTLLEHAVKALQSSGPAVNMPPPLITETSSSTISSAASGSIDSTVSLATLVQQVSALSTSVAQLQRLQNNSLIRRNSDKSFSSPPIPAAGGKNSFGQGNASTATTTHQIHPVNLIDATAPGSDGIPVSSPLSLDLSEVGAKSTQQQESAEQSSIAGKGQPKWTGSSGLTVPQAQSPLQPPITSPTQNPNLFIQQNLQRQAANALMPGSGQGGRLHSPIPRTTQTTTSASGGVTPSSHTPVQGHPLHQSNAGANFNLGSGAPTRPIISRQSTAMSSFSGAATPPLAGANMMHGSNQHALGNLGMRPGASIGRPGIGRSVSSSVILPNLPAVGQVSSGDGSGGLRPSLSANEGWQNQPMRMGMKSPGLPGVGSRNMGQGDRSLGDNSSQPLTPGQGGLAVTKWENLPLSPDLLRAIAKYGIGPPNKIQARALPFLLKGSDIIAQAPPTQERIIAYVIPIVQLCLSLDMSTGPYKGPKAVVITTTVDQANQAYKLIRDLGAALGIRATLAVGAAGGDFSNDVRAISQNSAQVVVGTPARVHDIFAGAGGVASVPSGEVRLLILDEVDQLIARNLYEHVLSVVKLFPQPKSRGSNQGGGVGVIGTPAITSPTAGGSPFDPGMQSPFNPASQMPFPSMNTKFQGASSTSTSPGSSIERQTCIFSNTIPTDVVNFSQSIQVREPVRVLVRREGGGNTGQEGPNSGSLRHYYLYLALAGSSGRVEAPAAGPGTIGSGRSQASGMAKSEASQAREFKLEALASLLDDYPLWQAIIHVGSQATLEAVVSKLNSRQFETAYISPDMPAPLRAQTFSNWRISAQTHHGPRFLVVFDFFVKPPEVTATPLVINFDLPRSVEAYAQRAASAIQPVNHRAGSAGPPSVILNFIQAAGGDVEMLRSTECAYRFKCSEVPASIGDLF